MGRKVVTPSEGCHLVRTSACLHSGRKQHNKQMMKTNNIKLPGVPRFSPDAIVSGRAHLKVLSFWHVADGMFGSAADVHLSQEAH